MEEEVEVTEHERLFRDSMLLTDLKNRNPKNKTKPSRGHHTFTVITRVDRDRAAGLQSSQAGNEDAVVFCLFVACLCHCVGGERIT